MKVLVTHSYFLHFDKKQFELSKPYPPLATLLAASVLRKNGHEVIFHDVSFDVSLDAIRNCLIQIKPDVLLICDDGFNYLTKMCLSNMRQAAFEMLSFSKSMGVTNLISSSDSTDHYEKYINAGADFVILGEPEETLVEVLCTEKVNLSNVKGIAYKHAEQVICNSRRNVMTDLDALPFAAWDLLNIKPYQLAWSRHNTFSINMSTTRGCPFKCNWCAKPIYGNRYNVRSPQNVLDELKYMKQFFNFNHIWFCDDIFGLKPGWVKTFNDLLSSSEDKFRYKIQCRADLLQNEEVVRMLAMSGADEVWIGAESGSQKILDAMDKGVTVEQIIYAVSLLKQNHIKPCLFLQFGYPGENFSDIQKTIKMLMQLKPFDIGVSVSYPLPGTVFYESVKSSMTDKSNWNDSDELLLMYDGAYGAGFYKKIHRYVHKKFRASQGITELKKIVSNRKGDIRKAMLTAYYLPYSLLLGLRIKMFKV